jgi:hypothetical protein
MRNNTRAILWKKFCLALGSITNDLQGGNLHIWHLGQHIILGIIAIMKPYCINGLPTSRHTHNLFFSTC